MFPPRIGGTSETRSHVHTAALAIHQQVPILMASAPFSDAVWMSDASLYIIEDCDPRVLMWTRAGRHVVTIMGRYLVLRAAS